MDFIAVISELGGGLSAAVIVALAWAYWAKDKQCAAKDEKFYDLALSTQKTLHDLTTMLKTLNREGDK
jgi:hypothetical protein